jgi:hypothetical protein
MKNMKKEMNQESNNPGKFRDPTHGAIPVLLCFLAAIAVMVCCAGCAEMTQGVPPAQVENAATRTGDNLLSAVSMVMQDYADVQENGVSSLWSISKGMNALGLYTKSKADIAQLVAEWKVTKGDSLPKRIAAVLGRSDAPPAVQAAVVAKAAETVAAKKGT